MSQKTLRSDKLKKKRRKIFFIKMSLFFVLVFGFIGGLVYGVHTERLEIHEVKVVGAQENLNTEVRTHVEEMLSGSYLGILPKQNIFLYPKSSIEREIFTQFPRIQKVSLELDPFKEQVLHISLSERREIGVWCKNVDEEAHCYFIDKEGYLFAPAPVYSDGVVFAYTGAIFEDDPLGEYYMNPEIFVKITAFVRAIENNPELSALDPVSLEYVSDTEYKLHLASGGYIFFSDTYGLEYAYDNLQVTLREAPALLNSLEYIDIRIPDKVFYK